MDKLIISAAITGSLTLPTLTPYLPVTPEQIADEAVRAGEAGAACVHIHARDPKDGKPTSDLEVYRKIISSIKERSNVVIGITTGGAPGFDAEERVKVVREFEPEMASFNTGSVSLSMRSISERYEEKDFAHPWEREYLSLVDRDAAVNTFSDMDVYIRTMKESQTKPEHEAWCVNYIYNVGYYFRKGLVEPPIWLQFVTGAMGSIGATPEDLMHMKFTADKLFGTENYKWSAIGIGYPAEFTLGSLAIIMGGHVRVGLEDNIFLKRGVLAKSNADLVEKIVRIAREFDREIATPDEARAMLGLKGMDKVNF